VRAAAAAGELVSCQHYRGGEQFAALAQGGGVIIRAAEAGEPMQAEGLDRCAESGEVE
jgi:hypothetical protein